MRTLWIAATVAAGVGVAAATIAPAPKPTMLAPVTAVSPPERPAVAAAKERRAAAPVILARNLFSPARRPPARRFDPARGRAPETPPPAFVLEGVVGGAAPSALIRAPSAEGARVVMPGEELAGYTLVRVTSDSVLLVMRSDTLVLVLGASRP